MLKLLILGVCFVYVSAESAGVLLEGDATGTIYFTEIPDGIRVTGEVRGLIPGLHGFHVHALGDLSDGCISTGAHLNPFNQTHGAPDALVRHVGDLGNIEADEDGLAVVNITDSLITFFGVTGVIGRAIVVHVGTDDLGLGGDADSLATGNAGARQACGVIGIRP